MQQMPLETIQSCYAILLDERGCAAIRRGLSPVQVASTIPAPAA